jgi:hypothetical protein
MFLELYVYFNFIVTLGMHEKLHICIKFTGSAILLLFCSMMSVKLIILINTYIHMYV